MEHFLIPKEDGENSQHRILYPAQMSFIKTNLKHSQTENLEEIITHITYYKWS